jgi:hypothetical protein
MVLPITARPLDLIIVIFFAMFAFIAMTVDILQAAGA